MCLIDLEREAMTMYGFHTALQLLSEMQDRIIENAGMSTDEKEFQCRSLDTLIELVQLNYHVAMQQCAEKTALKSADELEHEAEQAMARLEVAFGPADWEQ